MGHAHAVAEIQSNEWIRTVVTPNDYFSGALLVKIVDAKNMQPVWLGAFNANVMRDTIGDPEKQNRVNYAVTQLRKKFPLK